jgi:hypothetical protein
MTKLRRKTVAPRRKPSSKRAPVLGWFYRAVNLPYRPSPEVEQTIKEAVERLT